LLKARQRAEQAKKGYVRIDKIEVIDENDFQGWKKKERIRQKNLNKMSHRKMWNKREAQRKIYSHEILKFKAYEKESIRKQAFKNKDDLYFLRRIPGNFLEHQYVWRENNRNKKYYNKNAAAMDDYLSTQAMENEKKRRQRYRSEAGYSRTNPVFEHADAVSAQYFLNNKPVT